MTTTHIIWALVSAYLVTGLILTRNVLRVPRKRQRLRDLALGAVVMPVMFVFLMLCVFFEHLWARPLIVLDFKPSEEIRAGPRDPNEGGAPNEDDKG